jgi:geranylgeranyl diphosphate synthase type II
MDALQRIEQALEAAITKGMGDDSPPRLQQAVRHAVMTPASRVRPRLCLAVATACGDDAPAVSDAAAASLELLHCASLVHDDLPCFDDADTRRGQPSVHRAYGERLAVLAGDGLIVLAFENLAWHTLRHQERLAPLLMIVGRAVGLKDGIVAGQAWECEDQVDLSEYHRQKTAALFAAATEAGAAAAGRNPAQWRTLGRLLARPIRLPMTCAMLRGTPLSSVSRSVRMPRMIVRVRSLSLALMARSAAWSPWWSRPWIRFPPARELTSCKRW